LKEQIVDILDLTDSDLHEVLHAISEVAEMQNTDAYVIGGFVRDIFLNRKSKDIDFVTTGDGILLAESVAKQLKVSEVHIFKNYGTAMFKYNGYQCEFVGARKESYKKHTRNPKVEKGTLRDDQLRRDFTINAMAISIKKSSFGSFVDPFGGIADLAKKLIVTPTNPDITFSDDPLRMLRAIRFSCTLDFSIEENTFNAIKRNADRVKILSKERITEELNKIIMSEVPSKGFFKLDETGILEIIFPEFVNLKGVEYVGSMGHKDNFLHTLEVLDNISQNTQNLWLRWAAILHDIAKPVTKKYDKNLGWTFHGHEFKGMKMVPKIFSNLKLPMNEKMKYVQKMVLLHLRPIILADDCVTDSAVRRLLFDAGDDIDDLMILCQADVTSKNPAKVKRYLKNFEIVKQKLIEIEEKDKLRNWQPPISGDVIMKVFQLPPCKKVGDIKNEIREAILEGEIGNNYQEAYYKMLEIAEKMGLKEVDLSCRPGSGEW
jgi:poly(A) polymerase